MDYIKTKFDLNDHKCRVSLWAEDNFERFIRHDEVDGNKLNDPVAIASKLQASPEQVCDLWSRLIRRADLREATINGPVIELHPKFSGRTVVLCLFEGMNPRDGLLVLDGDPETTHLLKQISDESLYRVLSEIREGCDPRQDLWVRALFEAEPLTEDRIRAIHEEFDYSETGRSLIFMIRSCQQKRWSVNPINAAYVRQRLEDIGGL